jgi:hypothetical protein
MLGQTSVDVLQTKTRKKSSFRSMFGNEWFPSLSLTEKFHSLTT